MSSCRRVCSAELTATHLTLQPTCRVVQHFFGLRASYYEAPGAAVGTGTAEAAPPKPMPPVVPIKREAVKLTRPKAKVTALYNPALGSVPSLKDLPRRLSGTQPAVKAESAAEAELKSEPGLQPAHSSQPGVQQHRVATDDMDDSSSTSDSPPLAGLMADSLSDTANATAPPAAASAEQGSTGGSSGLTARQSRQQQRRLDRERNKHVLAELTGLTAPTPEDKVRVWLVPLLLPLLLLSSRLTLLVAGTCLQEAQG